MYLAGADSRKASGVPSRSSHPKCAAHATAAGGVIERRPATMPRTKASAAVTLVSICRARVLSTRGVYPTTVKIPVTISAGPQIRSTFTHTRRTTPTPNRSYTTTAASIVADR